MQLDNLLIDSGLSGELMYDQRQKGKKLINTNQILNSRNLR